MKKNLIAASIATLVASTLATGAGAASAAIEAAKADCIVGEQSDGYLGVVDGATASESIRRELRATNQQRKSTYAGVASKNGATIEDTAALFGKKLVEGADSGECVQLPDGSWAKQP
ncbi:MAG TPA: YdbL family protein [Parvularculaceae bacterium]|nr:YdbL family protein [Parvularculaceae bacterium]